MCFLTDFLSTKKPLVNEELHINENILKWIFQNEENISMYNVIKMKRTHLQHWFKEMKSFYH